MCVYIYIYIYIYIYVTYIRIYLSWYLSHSNHPLGILESRNVISSATIYTILEIRLSGLPLTFHSNQSCLAIFLAAAIFFGQYMVPKNQRDQMLLFC